MSGLDVESCVLDVGVDPQHDLLLLLDHVSQLLEDPTELNDRGLDVLKERGCWDSLKFCEKEVLNKKQGPEK